LLLDKSHAKALRRKEKRLKENSELKAVSREKMSMSEAWKGAKLGGFAS
jgi:hypothetical protein